jgi:HAD superfamily hydrolase (TIGR01509 family)
MTIARGETYDDWYRRYQVEWLSRMALEVGVKAPAEDEALALAEAAARHITFNCHSAFPDATPAIRRLSQDGFVLHTASGEDSHELDGYLTSMGVRDLFSELYGPDLTGVFKRGVDYYESAFSRSGLDPRRCLVVDDSPAALSWASTAGALTVLVDRSRRSQEGAVIRDLGELPAFVERLIQA